MASSSDPQDRQSDPLVALLNLGGKASRQGMVLGAMVATLGHGAAVTSPLRSLGEMQDQVNIMRQTLHGYFWAEYDIVVDEPAEPEKEPEPEPEAADPEPEVEAEIADDPTPEPVTPPDPDMLDPPPDAPPDDPYADADPAPLAAETQDVLTTDGDEGEDLTGFTINDKDGSKSRSTGYNSVKGTAKGHVGNKNARADGKPGGTGKGPAPPPPRRRKKSLARAAGLQGGRSWGNCPFPPQADIEQVDRATVVLSVTVGTNGQARKISVLSDPGYGFGAAARRCAAAKSYRIALDFDGRKIVGTTPPMNIYFRR